MPSPPARDTSATRSGPATFAMPDWMIGYSIPSRSHRPGAEHVSHLSSSRQASGAACGAASWPSASAAASAPSPISVSPTQRMIARVPKWAMRTKPVRKAPTRLPTVDAA